MSREGGVISNELLIKVLFGALHLCLPYGGQGSKYWGHLFPTFLSRKQQLGLTSSLDVALACPSVLH